MLQGRLSPLALVASTSLALTACAGVDGTERGAIRENVIEPGITAIDDSKALACSADAQAIATALEIHELMEGRPAADEAELVEAGRLREPSALWDVVDGQIVPADPQCGAVPTDIGEIVTDDETVDGDRPIVTPEQYLAAVDDTEIEALGGYDCALEVAEVSIAYGDYVFEVGTEPERLPELVERGYLNADLDGWTLTDTSLEAVPGTPCRGPLDVVDPDALDEETCFTVRRTLEVAIEAHELTTGELPADEQALVDSEMLRDDLVGYDVVDGRIVPDAAGCPDPPDVTDPPAGADPEVCDGEYFRLLIAAETFFAEAGVPPRNEQELIDGGYLTEPSALWEIVDGIPLPASGTDCPFPVE